MEVAAGYGRAQELVGSARREFTSGRYDVVVAATSSIRSMPFLEKQSKNTSATYFNGLYTYHEYTTI
jgi:transposase-like protein